MRLEETSLKPIYVQIAEAIEDDILSGQLEEGGPCYSQLTIAKELRVNPATAGKGITHLVSGGILEKQRGQAMMVAVGAREKIRDRKKKEELGTVLQELISIAKKLGMEKEELVIELEKNF